MVQRHQGDWRNDFEGWRRAGRIGPVTPHPVIRFTIPERVQKGAPLLIRWTCRGASRVRVTIASPDQPERVLSDGRVRGVIALDDLQGGLHRVTIQAMPHPQLGPRAVAASASQFVELIVPAPDVRLLVPAECEVGEPLPIRWQIANADEALLECAGAQRAIALEGDTTFVPRDEGQIDIAIMAIGEGGEQEQRRQVRVRMPELRILAPTEQWVTLGGESAIDYEVRGSSGLPGSNTVIATHRPYEQAHDAPACGTIVIADAIDDETIAIRAVGHDGRTLTHEIAVRVTPPAIDIDDELALAFGR
jgi:hypothetical protein